MGGWIEGWIVEHFTKGTRIKAWGQWSEEEEGEDEGRGKWEDVSSAIEFSLGRNGDRERLRPCRRQRKLDRVCV